MKTERIIDVGKPKKISFQKSLRFCLKGIKHRMLRSSLTQMVVVMAVAFFMVLLTESVIQSAVSQGIQVESKAMREPSVLLGHIQKVPTIGEHSKRLAQGNEDSGVLKEAAQVTGITIEEVNALSLRCESEQIYLDFFGDMGIGKRRILIKKNKGAEIFTHLYDEKTWKSFLTKLEPMRSLKLPTDEADLRSFLNGYEKYREDMRNFSQKWRLKVEKLRLISAGYMGKVSLDEWLISPDKKSVAEWRKKVTEVGFSLTEERLTRVQELLRITITRDRIESTLRSTEMVRKYREVFYSSAPLANKMIQLLDPKMKEILGDQYSQRELKEVVLNVKYERKLRSLERWVASNEELGSGSIIGGRKLFLAMIAFLVCVVGITNAMLMSVTERFMEIATMKCLGATDGFILKQFVLEAGFQGFLGGMLGMLVGLLVAIIKNLIQLGTPVLNYFPLSHVVLCSLTAIVCGVVLAMLAAIYPSWSASRMAPMEAMRVE